MNNSFALIVFLTLLLGACVDAPAESRVTRVVDSAGIQLISSSDLGFDRGPDAVLEEPLFRVGWDDTGVLFERLGFGRFLENGTVVVADLGAQKVLLLTLEGALLDSIGRSGEGPGEFADLTGIARLPGDSVLIADVINHRSSVFSPDGEFVRSVPIPDAFPQHLPWGTTEDGTVIWRVYSWSPNQPLGWLQFPVMASSGTHERRDTLGIFPFREIVATDRRIQSRTIAVSGRSSASRSGFVRVRTDRPELRWFDLDGVERRRLSWNTQLRVTNDASYSAWVDSMVAFSRGFGVPESSLVAIRSNYEDNRDLAPEFLPILADVFPAADGSIWVQGTSGKPLPANPEFLVVQDSGSCLLRIQGRNSFQFLDANDEYILGVELNEFDVHGLVMYAAPRCPKA